MAGVTPATQIDELLAHLAAALKEVMQEENYSTEDAKS